MNFPEEIEPEVMRDAVGAEPACSGLFPGDNGSMPLQARRVLCQLLSGPCLDRERHRLLWPVLLQQEASIRARLSELFLELVLDTDAGVAFTRQADTGELEAPTLLRTSPLTFLDSVLLLHLRQQLAEAEARGERAVVAEAELTDMLLVYEQRLSTDRAGFGKRLSSAITKMRENHVLEKLRGDEDRYEVSPALKLLFSAEHVQALSEVYRQLRTVTVTAEDSGDE